MKIRTEILAGLFLTAILFFPSASSRGGVLEVHHIALEHADSTLVIGPEEPPGSGRRATLLIDSGEPGQGLTRITPYLNGLGIRALDYTLVTHYHSYCVEGLDEVIYGPDRIPRSGDDLLPRIAAYDRGWYYHKDQYEEYAFAVGEKRGGIKSPFPASGMLPSRPTATPPSVLARRRSAVRHARRG